MNRREFMRTAGGSAAAASAAAGAAGSAAAQEGGGGPQTVTVGPGGQNAFDPESLEIAPGTQVNFTWESDNHNIVVDSQPDGANWEGTQGPSSKTYNTGHEYSYTFETKGDYAYYCEPHKAVGMEGTITVTDNPSSGGGEKELSELGVPLQAHYVGAATILGIIGTIVYSFFVLKYGESPNTGTGE